ncbi:MAG: HD domain-containing protein [Anaerotruncus sp.]|nr:MAG: HD domain-containing protein [Anaerotruncus sp.]
MPYSGLKYNKLSLEIEQKILSDRENGVQNPYRCADSAVLRRNENADRASIWRPAFVRDIEKIIHLPYYNRYADKTQVFSFYNNDDITRRALHVQLVSRIARNIGSVLGLNLDLIEAISLGHDIGHTPFGHAGERFLNELLHAETGRYFNHNVQSVRVLDNLFERNISLQTLDGVLCHNGEFEQQEYRPAYGKTFAEFDKSMLDCCENGGDAISKLVPATLEGCVVRICDMIAYLGKDRQDARVAKIIPRNYKFQSEFIGAENAAIINNLTVDIIENSYGKDYIFAQPRRI